MLFGTTSCFDSKNFIRHSNSALTLLMFVVVMRNFFWFDSMSLSVFNQTIDYRFSLRDFSIKDFSVDSKKQTQG